jgi:putative ABC transport system ATP-binding protein
VSALLEVSGLRKTFNAGTANELLALQGVDLAIAEGSFVSVVGINGSGKSTLLNVIAGTVLPDAGAVVLDGRDVTRWPEHRRAALIGRVFQNPFSGTAPSLSVAQNLALASRRGLSRGLGRAVGRAARDAFQERVRALSPGLERRLDTPIGALSGGQRQALTLLMASWLKPRLLLLDEHTAALDPKSADQVIRLTEEVIARDRLTAVMVTHSMQQAAHLGDRLVMMHRGVVLHDFQGAEKRRLRPSDESVQRAEQLDETAAEMLRRTYV